MNSADFLVTSPKGTDGARSEKLFKQYFPEFVTQGTIAVLIRSLNPNVNVVCEYTHNITNALKTAATTGYEKNPDFVTEFAGYWTYVDQAQGNERIVSAARTQFVSADNSSMLIQLSIREKGNKKSQAFAKYFSKVVKSVNTNKEFSVERTGDEYLQYDFNTYSIKDILITDSISATIALIVLLILINRLTMMVISFCNLVVSACISIGLLYPFTFGIDVTSYAPVIILAVLIAMTIDFSLFFLVRFRQEVQPLEGNITPEGYDGAIARSIYSAGKVICVSGSTLALAFVGMTIMGVGYLLSISLGAAISLIIIVVVNLSLGPSLLYVAPKFFGIHGVLPCLHKCIHRKGERGEFAVTSDDEEEVKKSRWYRIATVLTMGEGAALIIALVLLAMFPIMYGIKDFKYGIENSLVYTDDLPSMAAVIHMGDHFPQGSMYPFYMVAHTKSTASANASTFSDNFFTTFSKVIKDIGSRTNVTVDAVVSTSIVGSGGKYGGTKVPYTIAKMMTTPGSILYNRTEAAAYRGLVDKFTTPDKLGSVALVTISVDPMGEEGLHWIRAAQSSLRNFSKTTDYEWGITNMAVSMFETSAKAYKNFPIMVGVTCGAVIIIVALIFRSVLLPIRLLFTLGLTLVWTYGLSSLIFCAGVLDWTGLGLGTLGELYWVVPVIVITIIFGLGVDYDVFLFTRVTEYRAKGFSTVDSIRYGYYHTGSIITGAGIVMAIAFGGLMLSRQHILQHLGFFLSSSVLLDTFIVRMLLVPALLYFLGDLNWWPNSIVRKKQVVNGEDMINSNEKKGEEEDDEREEDIGMTNGNNNNKFNINSEEPSNLNDEKRPLLS